ncbi:hypothetical protein JW992_00460, partial [candidate division KSB1 bacterium]|nr:hypothetical protein [candidate division KSB1 bacterium]
GLASPRVDPEQIDRPDKSDIADHLHRHGGEWLPHVIEKRNAWLEEIFRETAAAPKFLVGHIPMICLREEPVLRQSFGFFSYKMLGAELVDLLDRQENLLAVLNGHLHLSGGVQRNRTAHVVTSGFASYPCHFARYAVYRDHIAIDFYQLPAEYVTPETNLHGSRRHGRDFTDAQHLTAEEYVAGRPDERHQKISPI